MEKIKITDDRSEMISIGKDIFENNPSQYDERKIKLLNDDMSKYTKGMSEKEISDLFYLLVYDYWVYGVSVKQYFFYGFENKTHEEKKDYLTMRNRFAYTYYLNNKEDWYQLENKHEAYTRLKEFYKRDVIKISSEGDYPLFEQFAQKHPIFVVKPAGLGCGLGVHKRELKEDCDLHKEFQSLLEIGLGAKKQYGYWTHVQVDTDVVLEEEINEDPALAAIHPYSLNPLRVTTIRIGDDVHFFYPRISIGNNKSFITNASSGALVAGIDSATGIIETNGFSEFREEYDVHPMTQVVFKGFQIPKWEEMKAMLTEAAKKLPTIRYVGWDVALSDKGWCIIEGNFMGEFTSQVAYGKGCKSELENLIGWKPEKDYWWEK